jgi:hypothetical protein
VPALRLSRRLSVRASLSASDGDQGYGPPRYFERRRVREAIAYAESGGIAVHRNFDHWHGTRGPRGTIRTRPFLHVIGIRPQLEKWGREHGLRPEWIQPEKRRKVAHYDLFGPSAERLLQSLGVAWKGSR